MRLLLLSIKTIGPATHAWPSPRRHTAPDSSAARRQIAPGAAAAQFTLELVEPASVDERGLEPTDGDDRRVGEAGP